MNERKRGAVFAVAARRCGNVYNWLVYCVVGNAVCRTWESCTLAFPCAVNGVIHDAIACYAHFHDAPLPCAFISPPRQARRGQRVRPALLLPGGVLGISQCQTHSSCQSRRGIYILGVL